MSSGPDLDGIYHQIEDHVLKIMKTLRITSRKTQYLHALLSLIFSTYNKKDRLFIERESLSLHWNFDEVDLTDEDFESICHSFFLLKALGNLYTGHFFTLKDYDTWYAGEKWLRSLNVFAITLPLMVLDMNPGLRVTRWSEVISCGRKDKLETMCIIDSVTARMFEDLVYELNGFAKD